MFFKQYYLGCLAQASYLIGDTGTGRAVVVDPRRDTDEYVADAKQAGLTIEMAILTHLHADFIAGHIELRDRVGATIGLSNQATPDYAVEALADGQVLELGEVGLQILQTPGHTPESVSIVVFDYAMSRTAPHAVLTGDTLFIGDVGRPDLLVSVGMTSSGLASQLYDSLQDKLLTLPNETLVYPGHGAGSLCGRSLGSETVSTMGEQRAYNYALQPMSREAFVELITADQPDAPQYFSYDADLNQRERESLEESLERVLIPHSVEQVLRLVEAGAQILDVREAGPFAAVHLRGATNVGLDGQFSTWVGTVLQHERPILIVAEPGSEREAAMRLGRIGFDNVAGYLEGGMAALEGHDDLVARFLRYAPATLAEVLEESDPPFLLDVRSAAERDAGQIGESVHIPLQQLDQQLDALPHDRPIVVYCEGGYRSVIAASILEREGFGPVGDLAGGYGAWRQTVAV